MKVLVVGLTPDYYSSSVQKAISNDRATMRSTNIGASFITRSIVSIFDATYLDVTSDYDISKLRNNYDVCIVSLASHLGPSRDVSLLVNFLKNLDIRTVFLSGGLDAGEDGTGSVSESIYKLIDFCSSGSQWIGVRGAASAFYLHRQGLKNVVPIGCPTMYSKFSGPIQAPKIESCNQIAVPFHWSIAASLLDELGEHQLIGQDCIDEEIFLDSSGSNIAIKIGERLGVSPKKILQKLQPAISSKGYFPESYEQWYETIGAQKALLSGRLHAAICGLTQGVPTVLTSWDLRIIEIIDYFKIPSVAEDVIRKQGSSFVLDNANFDEFNSRQQVCWGRWTEFLKLNNLVSVIQGPAKSDSPDQHWAQSLKDDNELLSMASQLQPKTSDGSLQFAHRAFKSIKQRSKKILVRSNLY